MPRTNTKLSLKKKSNQSAIMAENNIHEERNDDMDICLNQEGLKQVNEMDFSLNSNDHNYVNTSNDNYNVAESCKKEIKTLMSERNEIAKIKESVNLYLQSGSCPPWLSEM